jgi:glycosyltransferase involved in cell wall biosynthesis
MLSLNIAYILLHFPYLTETFVADEIRGLKTTGLTIQIYSLLEPGPGPIQPHSKELLPYTKYAPGLFSPSLWKAQFYYLRTSPFLFGSLLITLLRQPYSRKPFIHFAKRVFIFLKAVAVGYQLKDEGIHLLHSHFAWLSGAATWICSRLLELPFTVTVHAYDIFTSNDLLPLIANNANHIVAISNYNRLQVESVISSSRRPVSVIHCGVDLSLMKQPPKLDIKHPVKKPIKILSIGSLVPKKGHSYLIEACHLLNIKGINFTCTIIGGGPIETTLKDQIETYELTQKVKLVGIKPHNEVIISYNQHDMFALASVESPLGDKDGIPVVLMEAGAAGLPLISTKISGIPELVRHGETGLLVAPADAVSLANAIAELAANQTLRITLGQNARELVEVDFNLEHNVNRLAQLFHNIYQKWKITGPRISGGQFGQNNIPEMYK